MAVKTGVAVPTLRAWERRYGVPDPVRLSGGHRRYTQRDVNTVMEVKEQRRLGWRLSEAMVQAKARIEIPRSSILGTVRHLLADAPTTLLSKRMLISLSHSIEDEATARAFHPLLVGAFQHERFLDQSRYRWESLSQTSVATIMFAAGADRRPQTNTRTQHKGVEWRVPLEEGGPLIREWVVICDSPSFAACLVGTERIPGNNGPRARRFETLWTIEPKVVREATRTAVVLAETRHPSLGDHVAEFLSQAPAPDGAAARHATALMLRTAGYLDSESQ